MPTKAELQLEIKRLSRSYTYHKNRTQNFKEKWLTKCEECKELTLQNQGLQDKLINFPRSLDKIYVMVGDTMYVVLGMKVVAATLMWDHVACVYWLEFIADGFSKMLRPQQCYAFKENAEKEIPKIPCHSK